MAGGRPTEYNSKYAHMAREMIEISGFSIPKLAKVLDVDRATVYRWMGKHEEFCDGIRQGRKVFEGIRIHRALVKRAEGYSFTEVTREPSAIVDIETGQAKMVVIKKVRKHMAADFNAMKLWLTNMDQANWADRKDVKVSGVLGLKEALDEAEESMGVIPREDDA